MTNFNYIKQMTEAELAEYLEQHILCSAPWCCPSDDDIDPDTKKCQRWYCVSCVRDWLRKEAEHGESN